MLPIALVEEIDRLIRDGQLSQRSIAAQLRVSRGVVSAIARGDRAIFGRESPAKPSPLSPTSPPTRCPHCGYRVYLPCIICRTRAHRARERLLAALGNRRRARRALRHQQLNCAAKRSA